MLRKVSIALIIVMVFAQIIPIYGLDNLQADYTSHWANEEIAKALSLGFLEGYPDGTIKPDNNITRVEFFSLVNKALKFSKIADVQFKDADINSWEYPVLQKAVAAGYTNGFDDGSIRPRKNITRQEVAAIICRIKSLELGNLSSDNKTVFSDADQIPVWSKPAIEAVYKVKIMTGYPDGSFRPNAVISRGEAIATLVRLLESNSVVYNQPGIYGPGTDEKIIDGDVAIRSTGIILQNIRIKGDLIIGEEVGEGDVTLNNIKVDGNTFIRGGGKNSIHINGGNYSKVIVQQTSSKQVRIVGMNLDGLELVISEQASGEDIILEGKFKGVSIQSDSVTVRTQGNTEIQELRVEPKIESIKLNLEAGTMITDLILESKTAVLGQGTIVQAQVKANDVTFEKAPQKQLVDPSVTVQPVTPAAPIVSTAPPATSGGGGGGGFTPVYVTRIEITSSTQNVLNGENLQMGAVVTPSNATDKGITWSIIPGTGDASISTSGLVTGLRTGTITVKAVARDGSGIQGTKIITVINSQTPQGSISMFPQYAVAGNTRDVHVYYWTNVDYENGSVEFTLPEGFSIEGTDVVNISSNAFVSTVSNLGDRAVITDNGRKLTILQIIFEQFKMVVLELKNKLIPPAGNYIFSAQGDQDGPNDVYSPTSGDSYEAKTMTVLDGVPVSGRISLPNGLVAPEGGLGVYLYVCPVNITPEHPTGEADRWDLASYVLIPEGESSLDYTMKVALGQYRVCYSTEDPDYISLGYYKEGTTVTSAAAASLISITNEGYYNLDMTLIKSNIVSGIVSLPEGRVAPVGGMYVLVDAITGATTSSEMFVTIPEGQSSASYVLGLSDGRYKIRYRTISSSPLYLKQGYYSDSGTVSDESLASDLNITSTDMENININIIEQKNISGRISLPEGQIAAEAVNIYIYVTGSGNYSYSTGMVIPAGGSSLDYSVLVIPGNYKIGYYIEDGLYKSSGYYCEDGTTVDEEAATFINVASSNINDINMILPQP